MTLKSKILKDLLENDTISGQFLADKYNVSRVAVWNNIKKITKDGFKVNTNKKGYCLDISKDIISTEALEIYKNHNFKIEVFDKVDSTNNMAIMDFVKNKEFNKVFIAREQLKGQGRSGKSFCCPKDTGIYMTLILKPKDNIEETLKITAIAALSVIEAIKSYVDNELKIKWVNDIFIDNKKVAGILTKSSLDMENNQFEYVLLGIGINTNNCNLLDENVKKNATSIFYGDNKIKNFKAIIINKILKNIENYYNTTNDSKFVDLYNKHLYKKNDYVNISVNGEEFRDAKIIYVDDNYCLHVLINGNERILISGEVVFS